MIAKKHVYRVDDRVRVVNPRWIERIGYALIWYDLMDEVENDPKVAEAYAVLTGRRQYNDKITCTVPRHFLIACAKTRVTERGFGGNARRIIYQHGNSYAAGVILVVSGKRLAKTGTRFAPSYGGFGENEWDEPGGLADCKTHIILRLNNGYEIEACDVEPVK